MKRIFIQRRLLRSLCYLTFTVCCFLVAGKLLNGAEVDRYRKLIEKRIELEFTKFGNVYLSPSLCLDNDLDFQNRVEALVGEKVDHDIEGELWDLQPVKASELEVEIPFYYFEESRDQKPIIQPYDPRLTMGIYFEWIASHVGQKVPFHWSDWVDTSVLQKYAIFTGDKANMCEKLFDLQSDSLYKGSGATQTDKYCKNDPDSVLGFKIFGYTGAHKTENRVVLGKSFLYSTAPSPFKLVFLTEDEGSHEVIVNDPLNNSISNGLLHSNLVEYVISHRGKSKLNVMDSFIESMKILPKSKSDIFQDKMEVEIPLEYFEVDPQQTLESLPEDSAGDYILNSYKHSLKCSMEHQNPPKYFAEANLYPNEPQRWAGLHYDWRFFNGVLLGKEAQKLSLHRLLRTYLNFAMQQGLHTWIAHGSLLSWYWNGISFPWDNDIDVQMPISSLYQLAKDFNQSLIIENVADHDKAYNGMGKFFVDVGSSITHRAKGNGFNNIDARFIDVDSGLYIDITGLSISSERAPERYDYMIDLDTANKKLFEERTKDIEDDANKNIERNRILKAYNCRNKHFATHGEISPLVLTSFENKKSYISQKFFLPLYSEYGEKGLVYKNFGDFFFSSNLRIWIEKRQILKYMKDPVEWVNSRIPNEKKTDSNNGGSSGVTLNSIRKRVSSLLEQYSISTLKRDDYFNLLHDNNILKNYLKTKDFTSFHAKEIVNLEKRDYVAAEKLMKIEESSNYFGKSLFQDPFIFKLRKTNWDYSKEIEKITSQ